MNNIESILQNLTNNPDKRWRATGNNEHFPLCSKELMMVNLARDDFLGLAVMQEVNMGGKKYIFLCFACLPAHVSLSCLILTAI